MPRITSKQSRRLGLNLSGREKDGFVKRPFAPGILDSQRKHKSGFSEYGQQLKAKQIVRISYGLREKQFANYVEKAMATKTKDTGLSIFQSLESRLDNVAYRSGFANTRALARQLVSHGHICVNGKKVSIPSYQMKEGDVISVRENSRQNTYFIKKLEKFNDSIASVPSWLEYSAKENSFKVKALAKEIDPTFNFQTIIEYYSR
jgi:small subunit ribosomal protein S4